MFFYPSNIHRYHYSSDDHYIMIKYRYTNAFLKRKFNKRLNLWRTDYLVHSKDQIRISGGLRKTGMKNINHETLQTEEISNLHFHNCHHVSSYENCRRNSIIYSCSCCKLYFKLEVHQASISVYLSTTCSTYMLQKPVSTDSL